jgi:hypothetical protein
MPGSLGTRTPGTRIPGARALAVALVSSALLVSACGSIPFLSPTPTPAPAGRAGAGGPGGGGGGAGGGGFRGQRGGGQDQGAGGQGAGGAGQGQGAGGAGGGQRRGPGGGQGQAAADGTPQAGGRGQGQGQGRANGGPRGQGPQASGTPNPQAPVVAGEVDIVEGRTVTVATNTGWRKVDVPDSATITTEGKGTGADLVAGTLVAVTSKQDGTAQIVRLFPQGSSPRIGQFPMQGANAGNLMTNARIASFDGTVLKLDYNGEQAQITVPADAEIVKPVQGSITDIVVGARVQANGSVSGDTLTARSVTIFGANAPVRPNRSAAAAAPANP